MGFKVHFSEEIILSFQQILALVLDNEENNVGNPDTGNVLFPN